MKRFLSAILTLSIFICSAPVVRAAEADPAKPASSLAARRGKVIVKSAVYGFGGGLVVGLASQVFKRKVKNIFMFGSLGMYAGILLGIYVMSTSSGPTPYEGPDTYEDYGRNFKIRPTEAPGLFASSSGKLGSTQGFVAQDVRLNFFKLEF